MAKIWADDTRYAPAGYIELGSTDAVVNYLKNHSPQEIEILDLDFDAGYMEQFGGHFINVLLWMERNNYSCPVRFHSSDFISRQKMREIARRNGWEEVR